MTEFQAGPLSLSFGRKQVLHEVRTEVLRGGTMTALLGPNGSGKSTFLRAVAGVIRANGPIMLDGMNLARMSVQEKARYCAYMPQLLPPPVRMSVVEVVLLSLRLGGNYAGASAAMERVDAVLASLGIMHLADAMMGELSGGQRQMIGLAQALVRSPKLLLLDEPLSALDPRYQFIVMDALKRETVLRNMVTLVVLHDPAVALRQVDSAIMLRTGRVIASGVVEDIVTPEIMAEAYGVQARIERGSDGAAMVSVEGVV